MKKLKRKPQKPSNQAEVIMAFVLQNARTCLFCGKPSIAAGLFMPHNSEAYGGLPGKQRLFPYGLCQEHSADSQLLAQVEEKLEAELRSRFSYTSLNIDCDGNVESLVFSQAPQPSAN